MAGRTARVEGASYAAIVQGSEKERAPSLADTVADFKARFPDDWEALRLCPLQHGIETMIEKLNG